jgi:hypothetical protein
MYSRAPITDSLRGGEVVSASSYTEVFFFLMKPILNVFYAGMLIFFEKRNKLVRINELWGIWIWLCHACYSNGFEVSF